MHLNGPLAVGMGELMPGTYTVPMNPITAGNGQIVYVPSMGELLRAHYTLPQNPLKRSLGGCGLGCGCPGTYDGGMGALDLSGAWDSVTNTVSNVWDTAKSAISSTGLNPWVVGGGVALLALLLFRPGGSEYSRAMSAAKSRYREEVGRIRARYPRVSGRARRALEAF